MITRRHLVQGVGLAFAAPWGRAAAPATRVVSIGGAVTETVYALGAQGLLVGVDTTSLYPAAARALPNVGYARSLSAEGVLSLAPTLVVAGEEAGPPAVLRQLEAAKVPVQVLAADHSVAGVAERTRQLAALLGREDAGRALAAQLQRDAQAASAKVAALSGPAPRVLFILAHSMSQVRVAGQRTAADAMLRLAGATNALSGFDGYKPLNPEAAIAAAPDVLLVTNQGLEAAGGIDGLLRAPGLAATPAGRARRVASLDALWLLGFGPRLPSAMTTLAEALRGGAAR
ncbi:MAG TPA: ABC transporter substrate-binding protein [Ideonella sp.]|uniref:heme/hemin ABC transporter substrate-binding protein n=1 Tax=Ideonella sp. TaxID=1929293 RepID=UPI002E2F081A|nr:ABC transporter substrate-binding protein [Ideonella sp.]HEX5686866.1 ABC transporter substrate-binding protein [Ideonella sp.]